MKKDIFLKGIETVSNWWTNSFLKKIPDDKKEKFKRSMIENFNAYYNYADFFNKQNDIWIQSDRYKPSQVLINAIYYAGLSLYDFPAKAYSIIKDDGTVIVFNPDPDNNIPYRSIIFKPKENS